MQEFLAAIWRKINLTFFIFEYFVVSEMREVGRDTLSSLAVVQHNSETRRLETNKMTKRKYVRCSLLFLLM